MKVQYNESSTPINIKNDHIIIIFEENIITINESTRENHNIWNVIFWDNGSLLVRLIFKELNVPSQYFAEKIFYEDLILEIVIIIWHLEASLFKHATEFNALLSSRRVY